MAWRRGSLDLARLQPHFKSETEGRSVLQGVCDSRAERADGRAMALRQTGLNKGVQQTTYSVRSCLAPATPRA
jgi:hypothetical protein